MINKQAANFDFFLKKDQNATFDNYDDANSFRNIPKLPKKDKLIYLFFSGYEGFLTENERRNQIVISIIIKLIKESKFNLTRITETKINEISKKYDLKEDLKKIIKNNLIYTKNFYIKNRCLNCQGIKKTQQELISISKNIFHLKTKISFLLKKKNSSSVNQEKLKFDLQKNYENFKKNFDDLKLNNCQECSDKKAEIKTTNLKKSFFRDLIHFWEYEVKNKKFNDEIKEDLYNDKKKIKINNFRMLQYLFDLKIDIAAMKKNFSNNLFKKFIKGLKEKIFQKDIKDSENGNLIFFEYFQMFKQNYQENPRIKKIKKKKNTSSYKNTMKILEKWLNKNLSNKNFLEIINEETKREFDENEQIQKINVYKDSFMFLKNDLLEFLSYCEINEIRGVCKKSELEEFYYNSESFLLHYLINNADLRVDYLKKKFKNDKKFFRRMRESFNLIKRQNFDELRRISEISDLNESKLFLNILNFMKSHEFENILLN